MTKTEYQILQQFKRGLLRRARAAGNLSRKTFKHAGHSLDDKGTGDEGWHEAWSLSGKEDGLNSAAYRLDKLLRKQKIKQRKAHNKE